ncbi:glycoside hydrolase family 2 protein [Urechidicola croceus]|uniref:Beta-glucuronidase n=1 Tax=Urechidicola croceus TaxID=1850246 RepID=A0A1D8P576_9FLAO|nr:glycoside hydrolase family 2 TIM barrel-domain containing protein [Urechidicola croceus]AOW19737.1 beta-glucuronidase [Urechidicola croceus]
MKQLTLTILLTYLFVSVYSQQHSQIQNVENRKTTSLNGEWKVILDQYETGYYNYRYEPTDQTLNSKTNNNAFFNDYKQQRPDELVEYDYDLSESLNVPGSWNSQDERYFYYEGTFWYRKKFDYNKSKDDNRVFVHFGATNYESHIYLNGNKLGTHVGGFTPHNYEITDYLKESGNSLVVKVDNKRKLEAVPTVNTDWFNYGGITRDVTLIETEETFIREYVIQLEKGSLNTVKGHIQLDGIKLKQSIQVNIPELSISQNFKTDIKGLALVDFKLKNAILWSPNNPKLYDVQIVVNDQILKEKIGFRSIETKGADILLNGKSVFLRGISIHEENGERGGGDRAYSRDDAFMILGRAKELNCNFVRLAHYPHNENMIRVAEELGIMVWEEIPVYWTIHWENKDTYENALNQLTNMIIRDRNRANVIIWSMANETPVSEPRTKFLINLIGETRRLDDTRLISAALEKHTISEEPLTMVVEDPFSENVDVLSFNEYVGWYDGLPEKCDRVNWEIKINKPVIISEFGGGAKFGFHGNKNERWTEEFQEDLYKRSVKMLNKIPSLRGMTPWILSDFRSPRRVHPVLQEGFNRKGVTSEKGEKKLAFYVLQEFYNQKEEEFDNK